MRSLIYRKTKAQLTGIVRVDLEPATHSGTVGSDTQLSQRCHRIQAKIGSIGLQNDVPVAIVAAIIICHNTGNLECVFILHGRLFRFLRCYMTGGIGVEYEILFQGVATQLQTGRQHDGMRSLINRKTKAQLTGIIRGNLEPATHSSTVGSDTQLSQGCHRIQSEVGSIGLQNDIPIAVGTAIIICHNICDLECRRILHRRFCRFTHRYTAIGMGAEHKVFLQCILS